MFVMLWDSAGLINILCEYVSDGQLTRQRSELVMVLTGGGSLRISVSNIPMAIQHMFYLSAGNQARASKTNRTETGAFARSR